MYGSWKYINQMEEWHKQHFKTKLIQKHRSPLQRGNHLELDTILFLDEEDKAIYQSLVSFNQWSISVEDLMSIWLSRQCWTFTMHLEEVTLIGWSKHIGTFVSIDTARFLSALTSQTTLTYQIYRKHKEDVLSMHQC